MTKDNTQDQNMNQSKARKLKGVVVSDKMDKTVVVEVTRLVNHPAFHKKVRTAKRYKAHDETNQYRKGDTVTIKESRPLSKDKTFIVL